MRITDRMDIVAAMITAVVAIALLFVFLRLHLSVGLAVTLFVAALSYILLSLYKPARPVAGDKPNPLDKLSDRTILLFSLLFTFIMLAVLTATISLFNGTGSRPVWFFIELPVFIVLVFSEIFILSSRLQSKMLELSAFVNVLVIVSLTIFSFLVVYPDLGFSGGGDQIFHKSYIEQILSLHFIPSTYVYQFFPGMHTFVSIAATLTGITDYNSMAMSSIVLPYLLSLLIIYCIYKKFSSTATALLATLFTGLSLWFIYWGIFIVPYTFSFIYFSLLVFTLLLKKKREEIMLVVLSCLAIIFTHSMTAIAMIILAMIYYILVRVPITRSKIRGDAQFIVLFAIFTVVLVFGYLSATGQFFSGQSFSIITPLLNLLKTSSSIMATSTSKPMLVYELDNLNLYILYFFSGIYVFGKLKDWRSIRIYDAFTIVYLSLFTGITYVSYGLGIQAVIPYRWLFFSILIIGYPVASGLLTVLGKMGSFRRQLASLMVVIFLLSFTTIISTTINTDTPLYGQSTPNKYSLSESDLNALTFQADNMDTGNLMAVYGNPYIPYKNPVAVYGNYFLISNIEYPDLNRIYHNGQLDIYAQHVAVPGT